MANQGSLKFRNQDQTSDYCYLVLGFLGDKTFNVKARFILAFLIIRRKQYG
jgi:hypothetical protein